MSDLPIEELLVLTTLDGQWMKLDSFRGPRREALINAGMREPPLVDVDGVWVYLTKAGRDALERK